jgi:Immunity protein Imm5
VSPERAIEEALAALEAAPDGMLALADRRRLRAAMGPWTPPYEPGGPDSGLLRRAALQVACVQRALPAWEARFPDDRRPRAIADNVMPALRGEVSEEERVNEPARALKRDIEPLGVEEDAWAAYFAGLGAVHLAADAWDGDIDPESYPPEATDRDLSEPAVEALAAWALHFRDVEGTRAYWRWYVTEAFPAAYAVTA